LWAERAWHAQCSAPVEQRETIMMHSNTAAAAAAFIVVRLLAAPPAEIVATLLAGVVLVGVRAAGQGRSGERRKRSGA
jgi:hypothetical protein